mmetsp:Transcript_76/g.104  ORF Transcript_76/g.104 Transcript_76/m.104 type:complete len:132 (-) Transcript_76:77-472(-)
MTISRSLAIAFEKFSFLSRKVLFDHSPQLCLASPITVNHSFDTAADTTCTTNNNNPFATSNWLFAVPKSKISHSRKRMKQFHKNHMPLKKNIVHCRRTGEVTLTHKLPKNWKDFIPTFEYEQTDDSKDVKN